MCNNYALSFDFWFFLNMYILIIVFIYISFFLTIFLLFLILNLHNLIRLLRQHFQHCTFILLLPYAIIYFFHSFNTIMNKLLIYPILICIIFFIFFNRDSLAFIFNSHPLTIIVYLDLLIFNNVGLLWWDLLYYFLLFLFI